MSRPSLKTTLESFDEQKLLAWKARRRDAFAFGSEATAVGKLLRAKARGRTRKTHRFFGEALVIAGGGFDRAHYGSFKWLTNPRFADERPLKSDAEERLRADLHRCFGPKSIDELQGAVRRLKSQCRKRLNGKWPTAPDLWLIGPGNRHRFIEVKLPGDKPAPHQLAGLAVIGAVLGRRERVSVEVLYLNNDRLVFEEFIDSLAPRRSSRRRRHR